MELLHLADAAAVAASASAHNAATIHARERDALCMLQAAPWLAMMQQQAARDPLAGCLVGLQQGTDGFELLLVRSSSAAVDRTGRSLLDGTHLLCSGVRGEGTLRVTDLCDLLPPPKVSSQDAADCISLVAWQAAA